MFLTLDAHSSEAVYLQLVKQIRLQIASGKLKTGDQLPAVRELALTLLVNPNTIQKAYTALASAGLIQSRKGIGMFVCQVRPTLNKEEYTRRCTQLTDHYVADMIILGTPPEEIPQAVSQRIKQFVRENK